ncbi:MAG: tRNA epoxyqueuosine(34) reductase QueG [Nitrososphaera sp.]|nr:tRNA epoxyqueuosine(34) reductase QueG [Nitrososphaera sp.]MCI0706616.1 tRNA epoxyqueuosine(34) reductase QueG [Ignavibacteriota bacterium]
METLTQRIKSHALELGFAKIGIARADALTDEAKHLREWLGRGYQGTMEWMERNFEKRTDPCNIVPNAKSVLCVAMNYYTDTQHPVDPSVGRISRYAWGDDYHIIVTNRLNELFEYVKEIAPNVNGKLYVDTGPIIDKAWAARAGIGWQGKHTNVITKEYGSWVFLGEIILDAELEYDEPIADFCGSCTACLDACPTGAIIEPYVLDSTKCISYLTIEHRGEIDDKLKPHFENWVYGCDICQDVCPWNKFQQMTNEETFQPRELNIAPKLSELVEITQEEFTERFRKSPIKRTKREGLARNAKAVLAGQEATA